MKNRFRQSLLASGVLAARLMCQAQVYSVGASASFVPATHRPDEIKIWGCSYESGTQASCVEWYVSTNALAKQPRWDGLSTEVPLSAQKACTLALPHVQERLPHVKSWSVESVLLCRPYLGEVDLYPDIWWYEITFKPRAPEDRAQKEYQAGYCAAYQIVLLDGTVVPQTILKKK